MTTTAYIFPGTAVEWSGHEAAFWATRAAAFEEAVRLAEQVSGEALLPVFGRDHAFGDRAAQFLTYAFSCTAFDLLTEKVGPPAFAAGYSMGIYAAVYAAGGCSFLTGLDLVAEAYEVMASLLKPGDTALGAVVGFTAKELALAIAPWGDLALVIENAEHSHVFAGPRGHVREALAMCEKEGALAIRTLTADFPYHHPRLLAHAPERFAERLAKTSLSDPAVPLVTAVDQQIITTRAALAEALAQNLSHPIAWHATVEALAAAGTELFVEPGPGLSLSRIGRFLLAQKKTLNLKSLSAGSAP
jgi:trans-AT polyketide synthase/acyltransferase/oxidoreductase domain-containing protein